MKFFYLGVFILVLGFIGIQQIDSMNTEVITILSQRNKEQTRFLTKVGNVLELEETLHSKQNEIDEMRANQKHLAEVQQELQDNYQELANAYIELEARIKAIEEVKEKHKGSFL